MTDLINNARQNLRLPQDRKDAYTFDARTLGLELSEYSRQALAEKLDRTPAKILARLKAIEKRLQELTEKIDRAGADTLIPFAKNPPNSKIEA